MAKLYFKYGAMGSSKTAQALITKFNYEERGMRVWLIKPAVDHRDGACVLSSRVGLSTTCDTVAEGEDLLARFAALQATVDVIIADECQFFTPEHINALRTIVDEHGIPVLCFGLRTDFRTRLFPGSERLFEVADSIAEIKTICACGAKATVNARLGADGRILTSGHRIVLGGNEKYVALCHRCYRLRLSNEATLTEGETT